MNNRILFRLGTLANFFKTRNVADYKKVQHAIKIISNTKFEIKKVGDIETSPDDRIDFKTLSFISTSMGEGDITSFYTNISRNELVILKTLLKKEEQVINGLTMEEIYEYSGVSDAITYLKDLKNNGEGVKVETAEESLKMLKSVDVFRPSPELKDRIKIFKTIIGSATQDYILTPSLERFGCHLLFIRKNSRMSKGEALTKRYAEEIFGVKFHTVRPYFLTNPETGRALEYDLFAEVDGVPVAIEFNGYQHYVLSDFHKSEDDLIKQKERDALKERISEEYGVRLITVHYSHYSKGTIKEYLQEQALKF